MYEWVLLRSTWNYHNIVNQLYSNTKQKVWKKKPQVPSTCCSVAKLCPIICNPINCSKSGFPVLHYLPEFALTHVHLILCCRLLLLPSIVPSIRVLSNESTLCIGLKYRSFSFSISPSNEYSGLISFRIHWFDLAVQGTLKSLLQYQFENINSLLLSLLYDSALTFVYDYWKNHSFYYTD